MDKDIFLAITNDICNKKRINERVLIDYLQTDHKNQEWKITELKHIIKAKAKLYIAYSQTSKQEIKGLIDDSEILIKKIANKLHSNLDFINLNNLQLIPTNYNYSEEDLNSLRLLSHSYGTLANCNNKLYRLISMKDDFVKSIEPNALSINNAKKSINLDTLIISKLDPGIQKSKDLKHEALMHRKIALTYCSNLIFNAYTNFESIKNNQKLYKHIKKQVPCFMNHLKEALRCSDNKQKIAKQKKRLISVNKAAYAINILSSKYQKQLREIIVSL
jgi:hypothetical protein